MKMIALLLFGILGAAYGMDIDPWSMVGDCTIDARCPTIDNSLSPTFLAQPTNCNKFFQCAYGKACELTCPIGLHWSVQLNRCEWPNVACCDPSVTCLPLSPTPTTAPTVVPPGNNAPNPTQCTADARCPMGDDSNNPTLLPHETNCGLFYACSYGRRCPLQCKTGEHFSVLLQRCDWPQFACCDSTIACQQLPNTPAIPTESPSTDCRPDSRCPYGDDSINPLLLPVPGNCGTFYKCHNGDACLLPCPTGQHFSQTLQRCEWPHTACCDPSVTCSRSPLLELLSLRK